GTMDSAGAYGGRLEVWSEAGLAGDDEVRIRADSDCRSQAPDYGGMVPRLGFGAGSPSAIDSIGGRKVSSDSKTSLCAIRRLHRREWEDDGPQPADRVVPRTGSRPGVACRRRLATIGR